MFSATNPKHQSASCRAVCLAALAIILPVLWFGPWVPFLDTVAFSGLDSYPPKLSYGPYHYYLFEFTYILPLALSRILVDLGIGVSVQTSVFYLAQMLVFLAVVWKIIELLVSNLLLRKIFIVLGALALWNGLFLWGGPLAFSISASLLSMAALLSLKEADSPTNTSNWPVALMSLLAVASHPFAVFFGLILFAIRFLFLKHCRWQSIVMIAALFFYQFIIVKENPEPSSDPILSQLFCWHPENIGQKIIGLFTWDAKTTLKLFGMVPSALAFYFVILGFLHLLGFICSPIVAMVAKDSPALRMLATFDTIVMLLYLFARDGQLISMWPQRILAFYSFLTYTAGIVTPLYLISLWKIKYLGTNLLDKLNIWTEEALVAVLVVFMIITQAPILRFGQSIEKSYNNTRNVIFNAGLHDSIIVVPSKNLDGMLPIYLHSIPFILFSDPEIVRRHLLFYTEWHTQPRHPSRLAEVELKTGRPRYLAHFYVGKDGVLTVDVKRSGQESLQGGK